MVNMKKALVTFAIGDRYKAEFELFRPSFERYCKRHNWDLIVLEKPLEPTDDKRFIICQKLLINCQPWSKDYDVIVWADSDMWFTDACPELPTPSPGKIGICKEGVLGHKCLFDTVKNRRSWGTEQEYYTKYGLSDGPDWLINAGLMVFRTDFDVLPFYNGLKEFYKSVPERAPDGTLNHYDQPWLGWKFYQDNCYEFLDWRLDVVWPNYRAMFVEPYSRPDDLLVPMYNLMDFAWSIHFTDREDIDVLLFIRERILNYRNKTLIVEDHEVPVAFCTFVRACKFKQIVLRSSLERLRSFIPLNQYGWVIPKNIIIDPSWEGDGVRLQEVVPIQVSS